MKLNQTVCGTTPKVKVHFTPTLCNHCKNAPCMEVCPTGAAWRNDDGFVIFDTEKCNGCKECIKACPYDVIYFSEELNLAQNAPGVHICWITVMRCPAVWRCAPPMPSSLVRRRKWPT